MTLGEGQCQRKSMTLKNKHKKFQNERRDGVVFHCCLFPLNSSRWLGVLGGVVTVLSDVRGTTTASATLQQPRAPSWRQRLFRGGDRNTELWRIFVFRYGLHAIAHTPMPFSLSLSLSRPGHCFCSSPELQSTRSRRSHYDRPVEEEICSASPQGPTKSRRQTETEF